MRTSPPRKNTEAGRSPAVNKSGSLGIRGNPHGCVLLFEVPRYRANRTFVSDMFLLFRRRKREPVERRKIEAGQDALGVGQVADDFPNGQRLLPHDGWRCKDLVISRDSR